MDILQQQKATAETIYKWWSITKIITAIAIMQLHEKKKINIDDPVDAYLPFFKVKPHYKGIVSTIKIKHLLNHSSGLPDNLPRVIGWMHFENKIYEKQSELLKKFFPQFNTVKYNPGLFGSYTNVGYMLLGEIIARVSLESYEDYVINNILKPLEMYHTHFIIDIVDKIDKIDKIDKKINTHAAEIESIAKGTHPVFSIETVVLPFFYHNFLKLCTIKNRLLWFKDFFPMSTPPSGLIGPPLEIANLAHMIMSKGVFKGNRILNETTVNEMIHDHRVEVKYGIDKRKKITYGLGWKIVTNDKYYIYHAGIGIGFSAMLRIYPRDSIAIILMANTMKINRDELLDEIINVLH